MALTPNEQQLERDREAEMLARQSTTGFDQLSSGQQGLAMLFTFLAMLFDPEKLQSSDTGQSIVKTLGFNNIDSFKGWQNAAKESNASVEQIAQDLDYSNFDFDKARELQDSSIPIGDLVRNDGETLLQPGLIERMQSDPQVKKYVEQTFDAAERHGLDGNMLANQYWQESRFNPDAGSGQGALGIAQIVPKYHQGNYGLNTTSDFHDPQKSIEAGAAHMAELTQKYGNQSIALVAYNGGGRAIDFVEGQMDQTNITLGQWMEHMQDRRESHGTETKSAWHVETYEYVQKIDSDHWSSSQRHQAEAVMADAYPNEPLNDISEKQLADASNIKTSGGIETDIKPSQAFAQATQATETSASLSKDFKVAAIDESSPAFDNTKPSLPVASFG